MSVFLDTNIVLYALGSDLNKRVIAASLLSQKPIISTQVINECSHVLRRKRQYAPEEVSRELSAIIKAVTLVDVGLHHTCLKSGTSLLAQKLTNLFMV